MRNRINMSVISLPGFLCHLLLIGSLYLNEADSEILRHAVAPGEVPYILSLRVDNQHRCGAAIIQIDGILLAVTAASCIGSNPIEAVGLVPGVYSDQEYPYEYEIDKVIFHPDYEENDISLLFTDIPFQLNENIQPITLPNPGVDTTGFYNVPGWGASRENPNEDEKLGMIQAPVVDHQACTEKLLDIGVYVNDNQFCLGDLNNNGMDICQGDGGGPVQSTTEKYLAGINAWAEDCKYPGIYTKVSSYVDWIKKTVADNKN